MDHSSISIIIRTALGIASAAMLALFIYPITRDIFNAGNAAGIALSAALLMICVFYERFCGIITSLYRSVPGKIVLAAAAVLIVASVICAAVMSILMNKAASNAPPSGDTTVIVLGCKVKDGRPSRMLRCRLDAAYDFLADNPEAYAVVSGGKGDDETISEAQCMYDYLCGRGISPERLYIEDKSTDTRENLIFSKEIIEREGLSNNITLITDGFHQYRASMLAKEIGIKPYAVSADTLWWLIPTYYVREWMGIAYYAVR